MSNIPVLIYHEANTKRINGGGLNQSYVKYCIKQTEKYNEKVVFLGHPSMKSYAKEFEDVTEYELPRYEEFKSVFVNMSDYKESWTLSCFKAYFAYEEYMKRHGIEECMILDSDVLIYHTFTTEDEYSKKDAALLVPLSQKMDDVPFDNDMDWVAAGIVGYFKCSAMTAFCDYLIDMFRNHQDVMEKKWELHKKYKIDGGICDMTLMYLWYKSNEDNIYNLLNEKAPLYFDENLADVRGFMPGKYGLKKVGFEKHKPYVVLENGEKKNTLMLHFVGTSKAFLYDYYKYEGIGFKSVMRQFYLTSIFPILLKIKNVGK